MSRFVNNLLSLLSVTSRHSSSIIPYKKSVFLYKEFAYLYKECAFPFKESRFFIRNKNCFIRNVVKAYHFFQFQLLCAQSALLVIHFIEESHP